MDDEFDYSGTDSDSVADVESIGEVESDDTGQADSLPNTNDSSDSVSNAVGSDSLLFPDSENNQENTENSSVSDTETGMEGSEIFSEMTGDYMPELEYIDYLLKEQLTNMQAVTVSGNSISVSLDNGSLQALTEVKENQISIQEEIKTISVLVSCVIFALCAEFLFNSAKRVVKNMTNRKE